MKTYKCHSSYWYSVTCHEVSSFCQAPGPHLNLNSTCDHAEFKGITTVHVWKIQKKFVPQNRFPWYMNQFIPILTLSNHITLWQKTSFHCKNQACKTMYNFSYYNQVFWEQLQNLCWIYVVSHVLWNTRNILGFLNLPFMTLFLVQVAVSQV